MKEENVNTITPYQMTEFATGYIRPSPAEVRELARRLYAAELAQEAAQKRIADLEKDTEQLICERDACEEVICNLYESVMGHSPEWTSAFGYEHAELEVMDQCDEWRKRAEKG